MTLPQSKLDEAVERLRYRGTACYLNNNEKYIGVPVAELDIVLAALAERSKTADGFNFHFRSDDRQSTSRWICTLEGCDWIGSDAYAHMRKHGTIRSGGQT